MIVPIAGLLLQTVRVVGVGAAFPTIGAALRTAEPGDTVLVRPGVYREPTLVVDRSVVMRGLPGAVLDGEGRRERDAAAFVVNLDPRGADLTRADPEVLAARGEHQADAAPTHHRRVELWHAIAAALLLFLLLESALLART